MLRRRIADEFLPRAPTSKLAVSLESFGFKHGLARDADIVLDVRFLPNPHGRRTSARSPATTSGARLRRADTASSQPSSSASSRLLHYLLPRYVAEGRRTSPSPSAAPAAATAPSRSPSTSPAACVQRDDVPWRSPIATSRWPTAATATAARPEPRELTHIT